MHMKRKPLKIRTNHPAAVVACGFMGLSAVVRLTYYLVSPLTPDVLFVHVLLPVLANVLFLAGILAGERFPGVTVPMTVAAVAVGVTFFLLKAAEFAPLHRALCTVLYLAVLSLYTLTVMGVIPTKNLLYPLFGLPLLYHIFVEDMQLYVLADPPVPVWEWMPEISVLCIMAALFSLTFAMYLSPAVSQSYK